MNKMKKQIYEMPQTCLRTIENANMLAGSGSVNPTSVGGSFKGTANTGYTDAKSHQYSVWEDNSEDE